MVSSQVTCMHLWEKHTLLLSQFNVNIIYSIKYKIYNGASFISPKIM